MSFIQQPKTRLWNAVDSLALENKSQQPLSYDECQDVEKEAPQPADSPEVTNNSPMLSHSPSSTLNANGHGLKHILNSKESPTLSTYRNQSPTYRTLPIISGILIPFSLLLSIPSLTSHWHIRTDSNSVTIETHPDPLLLTLGMGFSMACGVLANICLVIRFAERNVLRMTWLCILFLTLHDLMNISAITISIFNDQLHFRDGFTYGQPFWFTVYSTITSTATNITLIVDYFLTKDFANSGSGLSHKQRSLVIVIIVLLSYLALGALIQSFTLSISFIDALYFSVASVETIGFGDIHPTSTGARIFSTFYISGGMLNLAFAVVLLREVLLEGMALRFQTRVKAIRTRQRERRIRTRWRTAVKLRLRDNNLPMWVVDSSGENEEQDWQYHHRHYWWKWTAHCLGFLSKGLSRERADGRRRKRKHLNLEALTERQMEDAALEAGAPLVDLLPPGLQLASQTVTGDDLEGEDDEEPISDRGGVPFAQSLTMQDEASLEDTLVAEERFAFVARLTVALLAFIVFWMAGSVIFMKTERWDFGSAVYFCFISFTTVGYGDLSPQTPAGRSIFVAWALVGVATVTILISILAEAFSRHIRSVIRTDIFPNGINTTDNRSETRQIRFLESPGTVNTGTIVSSLQLPVSSSSFGAPSFVPATSSGTGHRDKAPIPEDGSQKHKKESLQSLHEILRHAQILRSLIAPENWLKVEDTKTIESTSNPADLIAPQITLIRGPTKEVHKASQIEKSTQDIITAAQYALEVLDITRVQNNNPT